MAFYQPLLDFLIGKTLYTGEGIILGQALSGALAIKGGPNKDGKLHWFHAFVLSVLTGFSGGLFNVMWMGKTTPMIANDWVLASCVMAFIVVNYIPFGPDLLGFMPVKLAVTVYSTLFKSLGLCNFVTTAFTAFQDSPSQFYSIPTLGPIWYGIMLGNMGGFALKGVDGYLANGVPWPFQNGIFCAPLFLFYAHDTKGPIGDTMRTALGPIHGLFPDLEDRAFAVAMVGLFMQLVSILQLPLFLGPSFSPFAAIGDLVIPAQAKEINIEVAMKSWEPEDEDDFEPPSSKKKPRRKKNGQKKKKKA